MTLHHRFSRQLAGVALAVMLSTVLGIGQADAALLNFSFTGGISNVSGALLPTLNLGSAPVAGTFQIDTSTSGVGGHYPGAVKNVSLNFTGGYSALFSPLGANGVTIIDNGFMIGDRWKLESAMTGAGVNGYSPFRFDLHLDNELGTAFSGTGLQGPPSFMSLTSTRWRLLFENADGNVVRIQGALSSLKAVPLPASILLFGAGLIALVGLGAGGLRNIRGTQAQI